MRGHRTPAPRAGGLRRATVHARPSPSRANRYGSRSRRAHRGAGRASRTRNSAASCSWLLRGLEYLPHRLNELLPRPRFGPHLRASVSRKAIDLSAPAGLRELPLCIHPAALLEAVQRRIERALADLEHLTRELFDPARNRISVRRPP